ncbi:MAG: NRDE family protein [Pseudomonadales bacterium]|nr:NRDE family protein [Halieaceae bacterium]MCP5163494.1 NRDE family protein [Pseudomonadales bacterium]MCP5190145.1 NRDE family protein [Pseudomonadales bacterium]MCP5204208.1 NRDE family protein [Pseudomonadales bacterium]
MCLLVFAHRTDPRYPLVLAANRDEFHARPTAASHFWADEPALLAGRDLEQGGTWMGVTRNGRFAAITNYRDPARTAPAPRSRGALPLAYLTGSALPQEFLNALQPEAGHYAGFNLLVGTADSLWYYSNSPGCGQPPRQLPSGIYGLSNARLDTPWPKVEKGKQRLRALLQRQAPCHDSLATVVNDRALADLPTLQRHGMGSEMDHLLSAQFITAGRYGTRSSTSLWMDAAGQVSWRELTFDEHGRESGRRQETFLVQGREARQPA